MNWKKTLLTLFCIASGFASTWYLHYWGLIYAVPMFFIYLHVAHPRVADRS